MAVDESGRLYAVEVGDWSGRRYERLRRVELLLDTDGAGRVYKGSVFEDDL